MMDNFLFSREIVLWGEERRRLRSEQLMAKSTSALNGTRAHPA